MRRWWRPPSKGVVEPEGDDLVGEPERDDAAAHGEHVGVVVLAGQARRIEIVAEGGARAVDLVGGDLLALAAPADDDPAIGLAGDDEPRDVGADRRIVGRRVAEGAAIVHVVPEPDQRRDEVFLQRKARMVGPDRDAHKMDDYSWKLASRKLGAGSWQPSPSTVVEKIARAPDIRGSTGAT